METPPRTWRKPEPVPVVLLMLRNTSTYVEKTKPFRNKRTVKQKHLHVRGENVRMGLVSLQCAETPPRTWRKLSVIDE